VRPGRRPDLPDVSDLTQLPEHQLQEISHFFDIYRDLDPGKEVWSDGREGAAVAIQLLDRAGDLDR
jgi:inorganic pyrophosphatase